MSYDLAGEDLVLDWISQCGDPEASAALLAWLPKLANDPRACIARALPGAKDVYVGWVDDADVLVTFVIVEEPSPAVVIVHLEPSQPGFGSA